MVCQLFVVEARGDKYLRLRNLLDGSVVLVPWSRSPSDDIRQSEENPDQ